MKALVLHDKGGKYGFENDWKKPELKEGWAVVKVAFSGVCGSDIPRFASTGSYHHPMILGHEFSGEIESCDPNGMFEPGDKVAVLPIIPCGACEGCLTVSPFHCKQYQFIGSRNDGGFAEYCLVPETNLFKLPDNIDLEDGSYIEPMLVALNTVRRSGFAPGKSAVVFGAGPIGLLIACWLRVFGAKKVLISDLRDFSIDRAKKCGFEDIYNPLSDNCPEYKFDYAFEAAGSGKALASAINMLKTMGTLTIVGRDVNDTVIPVSVFETLMRKEITLKGCWGYRIAGEEEFLYKVLKEELIPARALTSHVVTLEQAPDIIAKMINKEIEYCKVLINCKEKRS